MDARATTVLFSRAPLAADGRLQRTGVPMAQMRAMLRRKKAAQTIGKITRAMAMVASAKLRKLRDRMLAARPYAQKLREMVAALAAVDGDFQHPLLRCARSNKSGKQTSLLVITSNRRLVGAYNSNVLRMAMDFIHQRVAEHTAVELYVTGKKGISYFTSHKRPVAQSYDQPDDFPTLAGAEKVAAFFSDCFTCGRIDALNVARTNFVSAGVQRPTLVTLLPMTALTGPAAETAGEHVTSRGQTGGTVRYDFSPHSSVIMDALRALTLKACLFECFLSAATSESAARKVVTMRATESADQMFKTLTLRYNRARQDHTTNELMNIIGAAEAIRTPDEMCSASVPSREAM